MSLKSRGLTRTAMAIAPAVLLAALAAWFFAFRTPPIPGRTLRIGFEHVPPVQIKTAGGPSGLAVETINQAAKRAGISLQWVETGTSSDEAFQRGLVDLWPIMADLPDRRKRIHISRPWLHTNHSLVLRSDSPAPGRDYTGTIGVFKMPIHVRLVRQEFPAAQLIQVADLRAVVSEVCKGGVSLGVLEDRAALADLREKPAECAMQTIRLEALPAMTLRLGTASTFESAGTADRLRDEIGNLYRDGTLAATMAKYSYYGLDETWATYDLMEAAERSRWLVWGVGILGIVLAVVVWQAASLRQRRRSEAALRVSEERFRAIFDQVAVGDAQITLGGDVAMVNERYCEVLGYTREELVAASLVAKTHPDDRAEVIANRNRLLAGETASYAMEVRSVRKDGGISWIKLHESLVRDGSGRPQCSIAIVEDVTARRHAEAALQESEKRFRIMADTAPVMIWMAGPDHSSAFFSQGWLNFTGRTLDESLGEGWNTSVHPDARERCRRFTAAAFEKREAFQTEVQLRRADGEYRWMLVTGVPRFESGRVFAGFIGTCVDITDVKGAQEEALARQKLESLGVLASGIAHDFNNLLGSVLTTSELVLSDLPGESPAREGVESIKNVADRAAGIVRQMMECAGTGNTVREPLDLSELVKELLQLLHVTISKRAHLTVDLPENLPAVRANGAQIRQVVMNLITNASEALGDQDGDIAVSIAVQNDQVRLTVRDTGCGMTEQTRAKIFDPFFTTKFAGRGLGLAAVHGIVRGHGGTIQVTSAPGQGSSFEVCLPRDSEAVRKIASPAANPAPPAVSGIGATILIVEDEEALRVAVSKMLRKRGFSVIEAADGRVAMDLILLHAETIDVILLDMTLPGMSGREVFDEVRRLQPGMKVVITTAYSYDTALKTIGAESSWMYLRKPYRINELIDLLWAACPSRSAPESPPR